MVFALLSGLFNQRFVEGKCALHFSNTCGSEESEDHYMKDRKDEHSKSIEFLLAVDGCWLSFLKSVWISMHTVTRLPSLRAVGDAEQIFEERTDEANTG